MFCHVPLVITLVNVRHMRRWQGCRPNELEVWMVGGRIGKFISGTRGVIVPFVDGRAPLVLEMIHI